MHTATYYIDLLLSGITVGSLYALIAIGYTMVYGILRLINFAHGDIFMMAGFFMVYISASMPMAVAIPVVLLMTVALGLLIERAAYKPLRSAPRMSVMISAIGVSYLLQNLATYITGGLARPYPEIPFLKGTFMLGALKIKIITVVTPLLTVLLVIALGRRYPIRIMAKQELRRVPFVGWVMEKFRVIFVNRGAHDIAAYQQCVVALEQEHDKMLVFIEGTRCNREKHVRAKTGAVRMAADSGAPVVPVFVTRNKTPFCPIRVIFGEPYPVHVDPADHDACQQASDALLKTIYQLGGDSYADQIS